MRVSRFLPICTGIAGCGLIAVIVMGSATVAAVLPSRCYYTPVKTRPKISKRVSCSDRQCDAGPCVLHSSSAREERAVGATTSSADYGTCCGPLPTIPNWQCKSGNAIGGPTGRCMRNANGSCTWEVYSCPRA